MKGEDKFAAKCRDGSCFSGCFLSLSLRGERGLAGLGKVASNLTGSCK